MGITKLLISALTLVINFTNGLSHDINSVEYKRMPILYRFDDYEKCFDAYREQALYCVVNSYVKPDSNVDIYRIIESFSENHKQHLRHDKLQRGLCITKCEDEVRQLGNKSQNYFVGKFNTNSNLVLEHFDYPNSDSHRFNYNHLINKCVNIELMHGFNLSAFSSVEYCSSWDDGSPLYALDIGILLCVALMITLSSIYDIQHDDIVVATKIKQVFKILSIKKNWKILSTPVKGDSKELVCIDCFRMISTLGIIQFHCTMYSFMLPSTNPAFIEETFSSVQSAHRLVGNPGMQAFLFLGGFLNAFTFMIHTDKNKDFMKSELLRKTIGRYLRLTSVLMFMVLMHATWLYKLGDGPFWERMNYPERQFCRQNWWTNLLLIDNYVKVEQRCLIQSWYLPVDFWLHVVANVCLIYIYKKPASKNWILSAIVGLSFVAIGTTVYFNQLEPVPMFPPENIRNQFLPDRSDEFNYFKEVFVPTHMNIGNYFIGVATGLIYHEQKKSKMIHERTFLRHFVMWFNVFLFFCLNFILNYIFYAYDFDKTSMLNVLIAIVVKHAYGLTSAVIMLGVINGYGGYLNRLINNNKWRFFGRISYATLMCHVFVIKLMLPSLKQPIFYNNLTLAIYGAEACVISVFVGLLLTLFIEIPVVEFYRILTQNSET